MPTIQGAKACGRSRNIHFNLYCSGPDEFNQGIIAYGRECSRFEEAATNHAGSAPTARVSLKIAL